MTQIISLQIKTNLIISLLIPFYQNFNQVYVFIRLSKRIQVDIDKIAVFNSNQQHLNNSRMLNPKHIYQLNKAISLILSKPCPPTDPTLQIKQGEQILHQLRSLPSYRTLLSFYLTQKIQQNTAYSEMGYEKMHNSNANVSHACVFVLLELEKMFPLGEETVWWHLLEFYYLCNQKASKLVLQIVAKHFETGQMQKAYQGFMSQIDWSADLPLGTVIKILNIIDTIIQKIQINPISQHSSHIDYISSYIESVIKYKSSHLPDQIIEKLITLYLYLIVLQHRISKTSSQSIKNWQMLTNRKIQSIINQLQNNDYNNTMNGVKAVLWVYAGCKMGEWKIGDVLKSMLWAKGKTKQDLLRQFYILTYFIMEMENCARNFVENHQEIIGVYHKYITEVQIKKSAEQFLGDPFTPEQYQDSMSPSQCCESFRYNILNFFMKVHLETVQPQLRLVCCVSFCKWANLSAHETLNHPLQQLNERILAYSRSLCHHPSTNTQSLTIPILRYLFTSLLYNKSSTGMLQTYETLLNIRCSYPEYSQYIDIIFNKSIGWVLTVVDLHSLWDFTTRLTIAYLNSFMDVNAEAFGIVFGVLEAVGDWVWGDKDMPFLDLFAIVIQLIIEEQVSIQYPGNNHKPNRNKSLTHQCQFPQFYSLSTSISRYICTTKCSQPKLAQILKKCVAYAFRFELYEKQTAFLYIKHLQYENNLGNLEEILCNMTSEQFWRGFDLKEYMFYLCIFRGIVAIRPQYFGNYWYFEFWKYLTNSVEPVFGPQAMNSVSSYVQQFMDYIEKISQNSQQKTIGTV